MTASPVRRMLWLVGALVSALVATVTVFEIQQAARQPVVFGDAPLASGAVIDESR